jgi:DNA-binding GntR family transcriptional regulator
MEVTVDECMRGEKVVGLPRRFESLHLALAAACRAMRVFRAIVQISALSMFGLWKQLTLSHTVASQLIGHDHARHILKAVQQTSEEALCCFGIPP